MTLLDLQFQTEEIDSAETFLRESYPTVRIEDTGRSFGLSQTIRGTDEVSVSHFRYRSALTIGIEIDSAIAIGVPLAGDYRCTSNGDHADPGLPILFRPGHATSHLSDLALLAINIDIAALTRFAAGRIGADEGHLLFPSTAPTSVGMGRYWQQTASWISSGVLDRPEVLAHDLARTTAIEALMGATLAAFPIEFSPVAGTTRSSPYRALVRRARQLMDDHAGDPITVTDVAAAMHVSARTLQRAFVAELDTTPQEHLVRIRLAGVRRELLNSDPAGTTIAAVGRRWGFAHLGRLASRYRAEYGEYPAESLGR